MCKGNLFGKPRLIAKIRSALPYLKQLAQGGPAATAASAFEKSMIDTTTPMAQVRIPFYESWVVPAGVPSALADIGGGVEANN